MAEQPIRSLAIALAAGAAGTAAMTLSQALEQRLLNKRRPKTAASVAENVTGLEADTEEGRAETSSTLHWLYGTGLGAALGSAGRGERALPFADVPRRRSTARVSRSRASPTGRMPPPSAARQDFGADFDPPPRLRRHRQPLAYNGLKSACSAATSYATTPADMPTGGRNRAGTTAPPRRALTGGRALRTGTTLDRNHRLDGHHRLDRDTTTSTNTKSERANA
jgi:hypothetical protein